MKHVLHEFSMFFNSKQIFNNISLWKQKKKHMEYQKIISMGNLYQSLEFLWFFKELVNRKKRQSKSFHLSTCLRVFKYFKYNENIWYLYIIIYRFCFKNYFNNHYMSSVRSFYFFANKICKKKSIVFVNKICLSFTIFRHL